jgi:hypothetical protein
VSKSSEQMAALFEMQEYLEEIILREAGRGGRGGPTPVVVEWKLFSTMTDAAYWLASNRQELWENMRAAENKDAHRVMRNLVNLVWRRCHAYHDAGYGPTLEGWFIAEDGDPTTWAGGNPTDDDWQGFEDLRRIK